MKIYFECGKVKEEVPYKKGVMHGNGKVYNAYGSVATEYNYKDGKLHGA